MDPEQARGVVEHTIAILRQSLNNILRDKAYDADAHNLCIAIVDFADGSNDVLAAYSNDSALTGKGLFEFLGLVPNTYSFHKEKAEAGVVGPYGCDGMAQHHTEPKLMNYLAASPEVRQRALQAQRKLFKESPKREDLWGLNQLLRPRLDLAMRHAARLPGADAIVSVILASEIDCCPTCVRYTINRFNARYPTARLVRGKNLFELAKKAGQPTPFTKTTISGRP